MRILNPVTGETVELKVPAQAPTPRLEHRAARKAARIAAKLAARSRISELVAATAAIPTTST